MTMYQANESRYDTMKYPRCGNSGLLLPEVSLGFWHNFGDTNTLEHMEAICKAAFDGGIIMVSHILIWQIIMDRHTGAQKQIWVNY